MQTSVLSDAPIDGDGGAIALLEYAKIDCSIVEDDSGYEGMYLLEGLKPIAQCKSDRSDTDLRMKSAWASENRRVGWTRNSVSRVNSR